jgi:regulator of RNase E activity RraA
MNTYSSLTAGTWKDDSELFEVARRELFTAVIGDSMDKLGFYHQFLPPTVQPLRQEFVLVGRAMPVLASDVFQECVHGSANSLSEIPFGLMLNALDDLKANEVYINTGSSPRSALWGELMTTRAKKLGAAGAVLNGYMRDTRAVLKMDFPTFSWGSFGQDSGPRYKVVDFRVPIEIGQVSIDPGDIVFGDIDGVCIVPQRISQEVFARALEKVRGESRVRKALEEGVSAVEAFRQFGIM